MGINTQTLVKYRFVGRITSLVVVLILLWGGGSLSAQTYQYDNKCTGGKIMAADVLANATSGGTNIPIADQTGGVLTTTDPNLILTSNDENAIIYGTKSGGGGQRIVWVANGTTYTINIRKLTGSADAPTVIDFTAVNPTPCSIPYNADATLTISGGTGDYNVDIVDETSALKYSNILTSPVTNLSINLGSESADKTYTITTVTDGGGCVADVTGVASISFTISAPSVLPVTGTDVCGGSTTISLQNSENGIQYYLARNGVEVAPSSRQTGDGTTLSWTVSTIGVYTVYAVDPCGGADILMNGAVALSKMPDDQGFTNPGVVCFSGTVELTDSEANVRYELYRDGIYIGESREVANDGDAVIFGLQTTPGVYTVRAVSTINSSCSITLGVSQTIVNPTVFTLTANKTGYCPGLSASGVNLTLSDSESGFTYELYEFGTANNLGTGSKQVDESIIWTDVPAGRYEVLVTPSTGPTCTKTMGDVTIVESSPPTANLWVDTSNPLNYTKCDGETRNFTINVDFTGVADFTYVVEDDKGNSTTYTSNGLTSSFTVNPVSTTTYTIVSLVGGNGCVGTATGSVKIEVLPSPIVNITGVSEVCENVPTTLTANASITGVGNSISSYLWSNSATTPNINIAIGSDETYTVTVTANNGCTATASHDIKVNSNPVPSFTYLDRIYCEEDAPISLNPSPSGGEFYIDGTLIAGSTFVPADHVGDDQPVYYTVTSSKGCVGRVDNPNLVSVKPTPTPAINGLPASICSDGGPVTIIGVPAGGTWSVITSGLSYTISGNRLTIDPTASDPGPHEIEYEYTDPYGCSALVNEKTEIIDFSAGVLSINAPLLPDPSCPTDAGPHDLTGLINGLEVDTNFGRGVFTGDGVTDSGLGDGKATFDPSAAYAINGVGSYDIVFTYSESGCSSSTNLTVDVGIAMTMDLEPSYCAGVAVQTITATPSGGTFSVKDPSGNVTNPSNIASPPADSEQFLFDPTGLAGAGMTGDYEVTYTIVDGTGCVSSRTWVTRVDEAVDATFSGLPLNMCLNEPAVTLIPNSYWGGVDTTVVFSGTGIVSNIGVFSPASAGVGTHDITCEITVAGQCKSSYTQPVTVVTTTGIDIIDLAEAYCSDDAVVTISASNAGDAGTYEFSCTTSPSPNNINPLTYTAGDQTATFNPGADPSILSWTYYVTYKFTPQGYGDDCSTEITKAVQIYQNASVDFDNLSDGDIYCQGDDAFEIIGKEGDGVFYIDGLLWGTGLTDLGSGEAEVDPSQLAPGNHTITYSYDRVNTLKTCTATKTKNFTITDGPVGDYQVIGGGYYCLDDPNGVTVSLDGSTEGIVYELYLDGNPLAPVQTITGPVGGGQVDFLNITDKGTYTIVAKFGSCEKLMLGSVYVDTYDLNLGVKEVVKVDCYGSATGSVTLRATGGSGAYTYESRYSVDGVTWGAWTVNTNTIPNEFVSLVAGKYQFTITDQDVNAPCELATSRISTIDILESSSAELTFTSVVGDEGCNSGDGSITLSISGGTRFIDLATYPSGYKIQWPASVTNLSADSLQAAGLTQGTYQVIVEDAMGCQYVEEIDVNPTPTLELNFVSQTNNLCYGDDIAKVTVNAVGGSGTYQYSIDSNENWLNGTNNYETPILSTGAHVIWVRDANHTDCKASVNVNIDGPTQELGLTVEPVHETCEGAVNGQAVLNITGGVSPYYYKLDGGATTPVPTTPVLTGLADGVHTVVIIDDNGCNVSKSFGINKGTVVSLLAIQSPVSCYGDEVEVVLTANPASVNYVYCIVEIEGVPQTPAWQVSNTFKVNSDDTADGKEYVFRVRDNVLGCEQDVTIKVTQPLDFTTSHVPPTNVTCFGYDDGSIVLSTEYTDGTNGTFEYSIDNGASWKPSPLTGLTSGVYDVYVREVTYNCQKFYSSITIEEPTGGALTVSLADKENVDCIESTDGYIEVDMNNTGWNTNYTYTWKDKSNNQTLIPSDITKPYLLDNLGGGNYEVTVVDDKGCEETLEETITAPADWEVDLSTTPNTVTNASINGGGDGTATINSITGGSSSGSYTYKWYFDDGVPTNIPGTDNQASITGLNPGNYILIVESGTCGPKEVNFVIGDITVPLSVTIGSDDPDCQGNEGEIRISILGGQPVYTIDYQKDSEPVVTITDAPTYNVIAALPGVYNITVTDFSGGSYNQIVTINTSESFSLVVGTVDYDNCLAEISITPSVPNNSDYRIDWTVPVGATTIAATDPVSDGVVITESVSTPGEYIVVLSDKTTAGCQVIEYIEVREPSFTVSEDITKHKNVSCYDGVNGYLAVTMESDPSVTFNYVWQNGATSYTTSVPTLGDVHDVKVGNWTVEVQSSDICSKTITLSEVTEPLAMTVTSTVTPVSTCAADGSGRLLVEVNGGTKPYTVQLTNGTYTQTYNQSSSLFYFENLYAGNYTLTVDDVNKCGIYTEAITVTAPQEVIVSNVTGVINCTPGISDGEISFDIQGGVLDGSTSDYAILIEGDNNFSWGSVITNVDWSSGPVTYTTNLSLAEGNYSLTIWDNNANNSICPVYEESNILLEHIRVSALVTNNSCVGSVTDGSITNIQVSGASSNVTYTWSDGATTNLSDRYNLAADTYTLTVTDNDRGCPVDKPFTISNGYELTIDEVNTTVQDVSCNGSADGRVELVVAPSDGNLVYSKDGGVSWQTSSVFEGLDSDPVTNIKTYSFIVKDLDKGCESAIVVIDITQPRAFVNTSVTYKNVSCNGMDNGSITVQTEYTTGIATGNFVYSIDNGSSWKDSPMSSLTPGSYILLTKDLSNGCIITYATPIIIVEPIEVDIVLNVNGLTDVDCYEGANGAINIDVANGWGNYTYFWRDQDYNRIGDDSSQDISGLEAGVYTLTLTDRENATDLSGCISTFRVEVQQPDDWTIPLTTTDNTVNDWATLGGNGTATVGIVTGGSSPESYTYYWYDAFDAGGTEIANNVKSIHDLAPGNYSLLINGVTGCSKVTNFVISDTSQPVSMDVVTIHPQCDESTGAIEISVLSGVSPYIYQIQQTGYSPITGTITDGYVAVAVIPGTYTVTVTDNLLNSVSESVTINDVEEPFEIASLLASRATDCSYVIEGEITESAVSSAGYTISWQVPDGADAINDVVLASGVTSFTQNNITTSGTYVITIVNNTTGCSKEQSITIGQADIVVTENQQFRKDVTCYGGDDGYISVSVEGREPGHQYSYEWSDGSNTYPTSLPSFSKATAGYWQVTVTTSDRLCSNVLEGIEIKEPEQLQIVDAIPTHITTCDIDDETGSIEVNVTGGTAPYYVHLSYGTDPEVIKEGSVTIFTFSDLASGTYSIYVNDSKGCETNNQYVEILNPPSVSFTVAKTVTCDPVNVNLRVENLHGGSDDINNFTFTWIDPDDNILPSSDPEVNVSKGGVYTVTATDQISSCLFTKIVNVQGVIVISETDHQDVTCYGGKNGRIEVEAQDIFAGTIVYYNWYQFNEDTGAWDATGLTSSSIVNQSAGTYRVVVSADGYDCSSQKEFTISQPSQISIDQLITNDVNTCNGGNNGSIELQVSGGSGLYYLDYDGDNTVDDTSNNGIFKVENLSAGIYQLRVSDSEGCTTDPVEQVATINEPDELKINIDWANTNIDCENDNTGQIQFTITGGNKDESGNPSYKVLVTGQAEQTITTEGALVSFSSLSAGTYIINVTDEYSTDNNYCFQTETVLLELISITGHSSDASCEGQPDGSISDVTITGTSGNFKYLWTTADGSGLDNNFIDQDGLSFGTYTLTITDIDRGGCEVSEDFVIDYGRTINFDNSSTSGVSCYGGANGAITLNLTGVGSSPTFEWSGPGITDDNRNNEDLTGLIAGDYTVIVTDGVCIATHLFTVTGPSEPLDFSLRYLITDCDPYKRTIEIYDLVGGSGTVQFKVSGDGAATPVSGNNIQYTVELGGTYTVTAQDNNNCITVHSITIPEEIAIDAEITNIKCKDGESGAISLNISGGSGSFSYEWTKTDDTSYSANTEDISDLTAGEYNLVVTDQIESCTREYSFNVSEPNAINIDATNIGHVTCNGDADGYINLAISGGVGPYSYSWAPESGGIIQGEKNQSGLSGGSYLVTVTDNNLCTATNNITINEYDPVSGVVSITDTQCDGTNGSMVLTPAGGSGAYTYNWSSIDGDLSQLNPTDKDQTGLSGGTYTVVIRDADPDRIGCLATVSATLTDAIEIINDVVTPVSCSGNNDGSISFDVIGGDGNYTYVWSTADGNASAITPGARNQSGLAPGTYTVTITDGRISYETDCSITKDFTVIAATGLDVNVAITNIECSGDSVGALSAVVSGGSGNYSFDWNSGAYTTASISNIPAGIYTLLVTDNDLGCTYIGAYTINQPAAPISIDAVNITDVLCYGGLTGEIEVVVSGGTPTYNYIWTGPGNPSGSNPSGLASGTYSVTIQDDNGCTLNSGDIEITQPDQKLQITDFVVSHVTTTGGNDGSISVSGLITGGTGSYYYTWYNGFDAQAGSEISGETSAIISGRSEGEYSLLVRDDNDCTDQINITISQPNSVLDFNYVSYNIRPCNGDANGIINVTQVWGGSADISSGTPTYNIKIERGTTLVKEVDSTALKVIDLIPGNYTITVTDANSVYKTATVTLDEKPVLDFNLLVDQNVSCYTGYDGVISGSVTGGYPGTSGYFVSVSGIDNGYSSSKIISGNFEFTDLPAGEFEVTVTDNVFGDTDPQHPSLDSQNCPVFKNISVTQPEASVMLSSADGTSEICVGEDFNMVLTTSGWDFATDGSLRVTLYDGTSYWEEMVNQSPYSVTVTPSSNITYSITKVADPSNSTCLKGTGSGQVQLTVNPLPTANISGPDEMCADGSVDLSVTLTGVAPWNITWVDTNNGTSLTETVNSSPYIFTDTPVADASYSILSVSDANSCSNSGNGQVDVTVNPKPTVLLSGSTNICVGNTAVLDIEFGNSAYPYTITYTRNGVNNTMVVSPNSGTTYNWSVSPDESTTYEITNVVDANGCVMDISTTISAVVTVKQLPGRIDTIRNDDVIGGVCQAESGVIYTIDPVTDADGGYIWTAPVGSTIVSGDGTTSVELNFDADFAGGYIEVYATNGCGDGQPAELWIPAKPLPDTVGSITGPTEFCQGSTGITFSVAAVANASHYRWELPTGFIIVGADTASTIKVDLDPMLDIISGEVRVTPYNGCGDGPNTASLSVEVYPLPTAYAGLDKDVCGDTYTLEATDPNSINPNWSGRWEVISGHAIISNPTAFNSTLTNISRGDVILRWTVTNNSTGGLNDCAVYDEVTIRNNTLSVSAVADVSNVCNGSTSLSGTFISGIEGRWEAIYPVGSTASFAPANASSTVVTNMEPGLNRFRWTLTQNGCESYGEVEVTNNEPSEAIINEGNSIAVCDNQITLTAVAPLVGTGKWTLISGSGVIDSPDTESTLITGLDYGDNVFRYTVAVNGCEKYDEITVRNNTLQVDAGADQTVCDGSLELDATVPAANVTGRWIIAEGAGSFDDANSPTATITNMAQGINRLVWELNQYGCISTDEIVITNDAPTTATVGSNQVVCAYQTQLTGNAPSIGTGFWSIVTGSGIFDDTSDPLTRVTNLGEGENIFRWTIMHESCSSSADIIVINNHVVVSAGKDTIVCGRITNLKANAPELGVGEWGVLPGVGGGTIFDNADPNTQVGGLLNGPNGFIWRVDYNGCISADTVIINNNTPYPVNAGTDQIITGGSTNLNATPVIAGEGKWSLVAGGASIANDLDPYSSVSDLRRGENLFRWTVTNMGCEESDEVTITNGETIDANAGIDQEVCDDFAELQANDPDVGIGEWSVVSGAGQFEETNNQKTRVTNLGPGDNVFRWTIYYTNTKSTDEVTITNYKVTKANAGPDRDICDIEYQLEANIPAIGEATWTLISGSGAFEDNTNPNTLISGLSKGANVLKYEISQYGCSSVDSVVINNMLPTVADAGGDTVYVCSDSIELRPNTPTFGVGEWRVKEGAAEIDGNWARKLAPGRNVLSWVISSGRCEDSDDIVVINNQPSIARAGSDRPICVDNVVLSANIPLYGEGTWELISGSGDISDVHDPYTEVTGLSTGKNRFRWTIDNNGCTSSDDVEIANNYIQSIAGHESLVICSDTSLLAANNAYPGEGTWGVVGGSGAAYFDEPHNPYSKVRNLDQGDNVLTWTISYGGCNSVSSITITNNNPTKAEAGDNQALCDINQTQLAANNPTIGVGEWSIRNGSGGFSAINDPSATVENLAFGDNLLRWKITNEGCESYDDVQISYNRIEARVSSSLPICSDQTQLEANNPSPGVGTWSIVGGTSQAIFEDQNNPNTIVRNLAKGNNQLLWTIIYNGCETSQEVTIVNNSPSAAYAGNSQTICDDTTNLNATAVEIGEGRWEVLSGSAFISDINDPKSEVIGLSKGDNVFRWIVQNETCIITDEVLIVNNEPSLPYAGKDEELCTPQLTLKASPPEYGQGLWTIDSGGGTFDDPTKPSATITSLSHGTNVLRWTLTQGQCTLSDVITVVNNTPSTANAGPDVQDCKDWTQLDANTPEYGEGYWTVVSGKGDFDDNTDEKTIVRNLGFDENLLMWTIQNGSCFSTDQVTISNKVPDQSEAGAARETCDDYIVLNANNPVDGIGTWTVISGSGIFNDTNQHNTMVSNIGYGENVYKWTIGYGECTTEDVVTIVSNKARPYAGEDDITYEAVYEMQAENPGSLTGTWTIVAGGGTFEDANFFNTTVSDLPEGKSTFRWTIVTDGCVAYDDVTIEYKTVPESGFTVSSEAGCYPLEVKFTNYTIGGTSFIWEFGDGGRSTDRNPTYTFENPGDYTVILTAPGPDGQDAVSSQVISVHDHPVADFNVTPDLVWIPDDPIKLTDLSIDAVIWLWEFGDGVTSDEQNPTYYYQEAGIYSISLTVENSFGCDNTYVANDIVEAKLAGFVNFPDAFAPRPDGSGPGGVGERDDALFKPKYRDVDNFHMQIFNRWGQLIFETYDIDEGWNGLYKGQVAPQAVYVYKANGRYLNGVEFRRTGTVLLIR